MTSAPTFTVGALSISPPCSRDYNVYNIHSEKDNDKRPETKDVNKKTAPTFTGRDGTQVNNT